MDRDPYPWIIWYRWKARNDKVFRGIDRDPLELIRFTEGESQAQFAKKNEIVPTAAQLSSNIEAQVISLENICLVDGSWSSKSQFSGCSWVWRNTSGKIQLLGRQNSRRKESALYSKLEDLLGDGECVNSFYMPKLWNGPHGLDQHGKRARRMAKLLNRSRNDKDA